MKDKLNLTIEKDVKERAKQLAKKKGRAFPEWLNRS